MQSRRKRSREISLLRSFPPSKKGRPRYCDHPYVKSLKNQDKKFPPSLSQNENKEQGPYNYLLMIQRDAIIFRIRGEWAMVENELLGGGEGRKEEGEGRQNFSTARCRLVRNQRSVWRQVCVTDGGPKSGIYSKRQLMLQLFLPSSFAATWAGTGLIVNRVAIDNVISIIRFRALRSPRPSSESLRPSLGRSDDAYSELLLSLILCAPGTL